MIIRASSFPTDRQPWERHKRETQGWTKKWSAMSRNVQKSPFPLLVAYLLAISEFRKHFMKMGVNNWKLQICSCPNLSSFPSSRDQLEWSLFWQKTQFIPGGGKKMSSTMLKKREKLNRNGKMQPKNEKMFSGEQGRSQGQGSKLGDWSQAAALTSYQTLEARYFHGKCWNQPWKRMAFQQNTLTI